MSVRGSEIALLFQYNKGNGNTIFLFLSKVTLQANGANKESGQSVKLCSKDLNCLRRKPGGLAGQTCRLQHLKSRFSGEVSSITRWTLVCLVQLPGRLATPSLSHAKPHLSNTVPLLAVDSEDTFNLFSCGE